MFFFVLVDEDKECRLIGYLQRPWSLKEKEYFSSRKITI